MVICHKDEEVFVRSKSRAEAYDGEMAGLLFGVIGAAHIHFFADNSAVCIDAIFNPKPSAR